MTDDPADKAAHAATAVTVELLRLAGSNVDVQAAGGELGKAALTLAKTVNNALLPIAAVNFAFDKAREYFATRFETEFTRVAGHIPVDDLIEPKASVAGPVLQALAFSHEENELKELYLGLLAAASDRRSADAAHPAFCEIIRQLSAEEASLIRSPLKAKGAIPIAELRAKVNGTTHHRKLANHVLNVIDTDTQAPLSNPRIPAMVDNWIRLGLVTVDYGSSVTSENAYSWVEDRPEHADAAAKVIAGSETLQVQKGVMVRTNLGTQFGLAVGVLAKDQDET